MRLKVFLYIFLLCCGSAWASTPYITYSVADGLPNSTIKAICQDSLGYMWLGTRNGLVRFDGYEFRTYNYDKQKENTVSSNDITCFTQDNNGLIWIGTFNWITLFDPFSERFIEMELTYPEDTFPQGVVTNIWIDSLQHVWISSKTGLYVIEQDKVRAITSLAGAYINSMGVVDSQHLIVEVMGKGAALFNIVTNQLEYLNEHAVKGRPMIYKIYRDKQDKVWLGAESNSIFQYSPSDRSIVPITVNFPRSMRFDNEQVHDIMEYGDSVIVFGTDNGLIALNKYTYTYSGFIVPGLDTGSLLNHRIMALFKDNQDALWVGTFSKGVKYCNPNRYYFNYYNLGNSGENHPVGIVGNIIEKDGILFIGHERGISCMDMATEQFSHIDLKAQLKNPDKKVELFFMYHDEPGFIYFYLLNRGVYVLDIATRKIIKQINLPPTSQVRSMAKDKTGNLWIAEEELSVYNPRNGTSNNFLSTNINNITSFMLTQDLLLKHNGNMLVGTRTSGVWEYPFDEQHKSKYSIANQLNYEELKNKNVNVLFEDSNNNLWFGTYGSGLFCCNSEKKECIRYHTENGLGNNSVCGILEDDKTGNIWVSTINGLSRIDPRNGRITNYTHKTGFPLDEVARKAFLKGSNGLFYAGGSNGLVSFNPGLFEDSYFQAPVVKVSLVESLNPGDGDKIYRFDNSVALQNVKLPFRNSSLLIKFSALNYFYPQGTVFRYKLEGLDEEWKTTERNEVVYTNLYDGKYTFSITSSDPEGNWSDEITTIDITVLPPFWRTIWAKIIYILLVAGAVYFVFQYFSHRKTARYKQQINQIEKNNIERYYQMKLELFTKFSHELRTPLTLITGPAEDMVKDEALPAKFNYPANLIYKNANRLLLLVNQLMDVRKMEHGAMILKVIQADVNAFLSEQIENFSELAKKKEVNLLYQNQYWGKNTWFDTELMEKVISNLISNAIKYTHQGGEIMITSREKDNALLISVRDNGEGIPKESLEDIFNPFFQVNQGERGGIPGSGIGLNLAKYVVNLHGGKIWVESTYGQGSEFFVELPFGTGHFDKSHTEIIQQETSLQEKIMVAQETENELVVEKASGESTPWILIAEDDEELRKYIVSQLSGEYSILEAEDGKDAFELAVERIPDLIISDIMMPHMDGIEFCKHIKENISTAHIPVILLTAKVMNESIQEGYEAMADDYIVKPFDSTLLKVRIKNLIDNRIRLRKLFSNNLSTIDAPTVDIASTDPFMKRLFEIIESRIDDTELSINDIASEMGVSRAQFFRKIKAVSDLSPNKLILNIRMKMAVDFLKTGEYTVSEVAYKVGFNDPAYFSKTFKGLFNISPSDFVKKEKM